MGRGGGINENPTTLTYLPEGDLVILTNKEHRPSAALGELRITAATAPSVCEAVAVAGLYVHFSGGGRAVCGDKPRSKGIRVASREQAEKSTIRNQVNESKQ